MPGIFAGLTDVAMTLDGDLEIGDDGDFKLVDGFEWLYREVNKRVRTRNPEWVGHPTIGAGLAEFHGEKNTAAIAKKIRQRIKSSLGKGNIGFPGEFHVRVVPVSRDAIAIYIYLLVAGSRIELEKFIYEYDDGVVKAMSTQNVTYNPIPDTAKLVDLEVDLSSQQNKYVKAIADQNDA